MGLTLVACSSIWSDWLVNQDSDEEPEEKELEEEYLKENPEDDLE